MILKPGDVILTRGQTLIAQAILLGETEPGESKTIVNHAGIISVGGTAQQARVIESLARGTVERPLSAYRRADADSVAIYRLQPLTDDQASAIVAVARRYVGRPYGWLRILADAGDWILGSRWFFRGMVPARVAPVCSGVVACAYNAIGYRFHDIDPAMVQPDDIWDCITTQVPPWVPVGHI